MKFLPLIWRQLARNKIRTALTAGAIGLAVSLVCLLLTRPPMRSSLPPLSAGSKRRS